MALPLLLPPKVSGVFKRVTVQVRPSISGFRVQGPGSRVQGARSRFDPQPCTLNPAPRTFDPTLNPEPWTLIPEPWRRSARTMSLNFSHMCFRVLLGGRGNRRSYAPSTLDARVLQRKQLLLESDTKVYEP